MKICRKDCPLCELENERIKARNDLRRFDVVLEAKMFAFGIYLKARSVIYFFKKNYD